MSDTIEIIRHPPIRIGHSASPHQEVWAIGDVHGRADLLAALLAEIEATPEPDHTRARVVVSLGDVIDRGPHSLRAIDLLIAHDAIGLLGNHEQMIALTASTREERWHRDGWYDVWRSNGGDAVLDEAYCGDRERREREFHPALLPGLLGIKRWDWLRTTRPSYRSGDVLLVHAGVDPRRPLASAAFTHWDDTDPDWSPYWIRGNFLHRWGERERDVFVVHGHTPRDNLRRAGDETAGYRLNADLGSYETGGARAVRIVDDVVEIVDAWGPAPREDLRRAFREGRT